MKPRLQPRIASTARYASALVVSPIARKQAQLYGYGFGFLGAGAPGGPPIGAGVGTGAATGAAEGASFGSVAGPIGAGIGAAIGAIGGAIAGSLGKKDPEEYSFDAAVALWQQNPNNVYNIGNKYIPLAGLFVLSLSNPHIPIYQKYGRMGEAKFASDLVMTVYNAAQAGRITASDTPLTIMANVVQPWINSWGYAPMNDPHADLINKLIVGMIWDYTSGAAPQVWRARGGDLPTQFANLPAFSLPGANAAPAAAPGNVTTPGVVAATAAAAPVSAASANPFPGFKPGLTASDARQTVPWTILENNYTATWTPTGNGYFASAYPGPTNSQLQSIVNGTQLAVLRQDTNGGWAIYTGSLAPGALSVSGSATYYSPAPGSTPMTYNWNGTVAGTANASPAATASSIGSAVATTPSGTTVAIPAGYTLIGTANGMSAYSDPNGYINTWNGVQMQLLTGTVLYANGTSAQVSNGIVVPANAIMPLPSGYQSPPPTATPSYVGTMSASPGVSPINYAPTQPPIAPAQPVAQAGMSSWMMIGLLGAAAYLFFGKKRPGQAADA